MVQLSGLLYRIMGILGYGDRKVNWAGFAFNLRSSACFCVFMCDKMVSWKSKKQTIVDRSSIGFRKLSCGSYYMSWFDWKIYFMNLVFIITTKQWSIFLRHNFSWENWIYWVFFFIFYHFSREKILKKCD